MSFPKLELDKEDLDFINLLSKRVSKIKPGKVRKEYKERRI
jgi:hypothetical protein